MKLFTLKRIIIVPAIIGLTVLTSAMSQAHQRDGFAPKQQIMKMMRQLDLSMEQKLSVRSTMRDTRDQISVLRDDLKKMRSEMLELVKSGNISQQGVDAVLEQYESSLRAMSKTGANTRNAIYDVLTDEQREKAQQLMAKKQARAEARDPQERLNKIADKLDFSDEQLASATELLPEIVEARTAVRETLKSYREAQRDLIVSNNLTDEQLDALFDEYFPTFKTNVFTAIVAHQQLYALLTDEQKEQMKGRRARMFMPRMI